MEQGKNANFHDRCTSSNVEQGKNANFHGRCTSSNVGKTIINHPFGDDKHSTYLL